MARAAVIVFLCATASAFAPGSRNAGFRPSSQLHSLSPERVDRRQIGAYFAGGAAALLASPEWASAKAKKENPKKEAQKKKQEEKKIEALARAQLRKEDEDALKAKNEAKRNKDKAARKDYLAKSDAERADKRVAQLAKQKELSASLASKRANEEAARKEFDGPYLAVVNDKAAYYAKLGKKNLAVASRVTGKRGCNKQLKSCKPEDASL